MNNIITVIIIGVYTIVYVIVFFIQKSQISNMKEINLSMKSYMDIFKIDEVKKYMEMKGERYMLDAAKFITEDKKVKNIMYEAIDKNVDKIKEVYYKQMGKEHFELVAFAVEVIRMQPKEKRVEFINILFPKTKRYFLKMLEDIENSVI